MKQCFSFAVGKAFLLTKLASYKKPRHILFMDRFPIRNATKVDKKELTQICDHALQIEAENEKNGGDPVIRQNVESILRSAKKLTD